MHIYTLKYIEQKRLLIEEVFASNRIVLYERVRTGIGWCSSRVRMVEEYQRVFIARIAVEGNQVELGNVRLSTAAEIFERDVHILRGSL